jgi:hypothetical protein
MGAAVAIPLILAGAGTVGSMITRNNAADAQAKQIQLQRKQAQIEASDKGIQRTQNLNAVISSNTAGAAAKNISLASPSYKAINNAAFGKFQEDVKMDSLNLAGRLAYFDAQEQNLNYQAAYGMFTDLASFGEKFFNTVNFNKTPAKPTQTKGK